jgi:glycosyltransferase involved in cell wall biosynthesis
MSIKSNAAFHQKTIALDGDTLGRKRTGDETYLVGLMHGLGRLNAGPNFPVYVRDVESVAGPFRKHGCFDFRPVRPKSIWLRHPIGFPMALNRDKPDLLHVQYFVPPFAPCPVVLTVHDISFAVHPEFFTARDRLLLGTLVPWSLKKAARVITDAEHTKEDLVRVYKVPSEKIDLIPLAVEPRFCTLDRSACIREVAKRHSLGDSPYVLYVGTLQPRKNVKMLIDAYTMMRRKTGIGHKLLMIGKPKYRFAPVFDAIKASGFENDILFTGFVTDDDLPMYYNAAEVFVFPSRYEGFGLPVLEAFGCGTPVITTTSSSLPEVAGDAAVLVDPYDTEALADAMENVLGNEKLRTKLRADGLARAAEFSWERTARMTMDVYERVLTESVGRKANRSAALSRSS